MWNDLEEGDSRRRLRLSFYLRGERPPLKFTGKIGIIEWNISPGPPGKEDLWNN
jgi:hypothetical protein